MEMDSDRVARYPVELSAVGQQGSTRHEPMNDRRAIELLAVVVVYFFAFVTVIGPAIEAVTGFETLWPAAPRGVDRLWQLVSNPQGWLLALGYVPVQFGYLFFRARLAGESVDAYWE